MSLSNCKNNLDVLAPGEESVSVYGILNPNESVQKIRINKVYLTSDDAISIAKDENQINYGPGELKVTLQRFVSGSSIPALTTITDGSKKEIVLTETVVTTASGSFNQNQRIWQTNDRLYNSGEYKLTIKLVSSGKEITAQSVIIDSVKPTNKMPFIYHPISYPMHGKYDLVKYPIQLNALINYSILTATQKIEFKSVINAKLYEVVMRFHYKNISLNSDTTNDYVDFNFFTVKSVSLKGDENLNVSFTASDFYNNLATEISKKNSSNVKSRISNYMEYIIFAGTETLETFLEVNKPSNTIAQDKPYFTNIMGGVGIFSSKSKSTITHDLASDFIDQIGCNSATKPFLFLRNDGIFCP